MEEKEKDLIENTDVEETKVDETKVEEVESKQPDSKEDKKDDEDVITISKSELETMLQSMEDKRRGNTAAELRKAQKELEEMQDIKERLSGLEQKEKELEKREKITNLKTALVDKGLPANIADFVSPDVDIDSFTETFASTLNERMKSVGYQPTNHTGNTGVSLEEFIEMDYDAKFKLRQEAPELYNSLNKKTI